MVIHFDTAERTRMPNRSTIQMHISPLRELGWALHVLARPGYHGVFLRWALGVRERLSPPLRDSIEQMAPFFTGWLHAMISVPPAGAKSASFFEEWDVYMGLPDDRLYEVYQHIKSRWTMEFDLRMARNSEWENLSLLTEPDWWAPWDENVRSLRDQMGILMKEFWNQEFEGIWQEIAGPLKNDIQTRRALIPDENPAVWWQNVSPRLRLERGARTLQVLVPWKTEFTVTPKTDIDLFPSVFCWPHLWIDGCSSRLIISYQSQAIRRWAAPVPAPIRLERLLEALSEPTRLLIVRHLFGAMGTTGSIAHALRLGPSTVSRHLALLHSAGLVDRIAMGHYVLYRTNREALLSIVKDFQDFERSAVPSFFGWDS